MTSNDKRFPRLLYVGDVPVEAGVGGSAFIYRLLQTYPPDCLRIVEGSIWRSSPEKRLPKVDYETLALGPGRLLHTRLGRQYAAYLFLSAGLHSHRLRRIVKEFAPEAVLTVAHGFLWTTAAQLASRLHIPLHFNINDDWTTVNHLPPIMKMMGKERFGTVYRMAATRWCASPNMVESYEKDFGIRGDVLYPLLAENQTPFDSPKMNGRQSHSFVFAYAGSIHNKAYADCLLTLASALEASESQLIIYSALSLEEAKGFGLVRPNIKLKPLIPPAVLVSTLRESADVIFVPMSFEPADLPNMKAAFPSKLPDCTAVGVPLLIYGPRECSAVRWALENPGVAETVLEHNIEMLATSVERLVSNSDYRRELGAKALLKGQEYFSHASVTEKFYSLITSNS